MKEIYFFSCANTVIISSKALRLYPKVAAHVSTMIKPVKSVLFFSYDENHITKDIFNDVVPAGVGNVTYNVTHVRVSPIYGNQIAKRTVLTAILEFVTIPVVLEIDMNDDINTIDDFKVYTELGFNEASENPSGNNILMRQIPVNIDHATTVQKIMEIAHSTRFLLKLTTLFPKSLADQMASYLNKPFEIGGKIGIRKYIETPIGKVAVLECKKSDIVEGEGVDLDGRGTYSVAIPSELVSPLSFHSHPDIGYKQSFLLWPSGSDITAITSGYLNNTDILAHFVISSEGIWVVHLKPQFQRILYLLKNMQANESATRCLDNLIKYITDAFAQMEGYHQYPHVFPLERHKMLQKFVTASKTLKITDFVGTELETSCAEFIHADFELYDIDLIKWNVFTGINEVFLTFTYILDPIGGLPANIMSREDEGVDEDDEISEDEDDIFTEDEDEDGDEIM